MRARPFLLCVAVLLMPSVCMAQYWGERATERSFEQSELYFESHYLNTYGVPNFRDVAVGTFDDPFLNLQLNPANLPTIEDGHALFHFDFRGDRTDAPIIDHYYDVIYPQYNDYYIRPDPRYYNVARQEPEPIFSFGLLAYPFREGLEDLFAGATYQVIFKEEPFYRQPYWYYDYAFGYDSFGERGVDDQTTFPTQERYYGEDEMSTEGHLISVFTGFPVSPRTDFGLSINTVMHTRDGSYVNHNTDEYGGTNDWNYFYHREESRDQNYDHFDINGGLRHEFSPQTTVGIKVGYLSGDATQNEMSVDSSRYQWGDSLTSSSRFSYHYHNSYNGQSWKRDGHTAYLRLNVERRIGRDRRVFAYYRYANSTLDLTNSGIIDDTSAYRSRYTHNDGRSDYVSGSGTSDVRSGTGEREERAHQAMVNMKWQLNRQTGVSLGGYFSRTRTTLYSDEPVLADRWSRSYWERTGSYPGTHLYYQSRYEDKELRWTYNATHWTIQIPVVLNHRFDEHFAMLLGFNGILERWKISEKTVAHFTRREVTNEEGTKVETNFAESYTTPDEKFTDNRKAFFGSLEVSVTPQFVIRLMLEPERDDGLRISQWWLSFELIS